VNPKNSGILTIREKEKNLEHDQKSIGGLPKLEKSKVMLNNAEMLIQRTDKNGG